MSAQIVVAPANLANPPLLLNAEEVAQLLLVSKKAVYAMAERGQLPGVVRIGRRIRVRRTVLLNWLLQEGAPSLENQR